MSKHTTYAGRVRISQALLLEWLQFEGGRICDARLGNYAGELELVIEHPEMPETSEGQPFPEIVPVYQSEFDKNGHLIGIVRETLREVTCQTAKSIRTVT